MLPFLCSVMVDQRRRFLFRLLLVCGCCVLIHGTAPAQLNGKPYQQWTKQEAETLLTDSPWAQTLSGLLAVGRRDPPAAALDTIVTISLRSALPVRQALVRLRQLRNDYDKKSDREKAAFEAQVKPMLECPECADQYVVAMSPGRRSNNGLPSGLQTTSFARVKDNVQLKNEKGETRELVKFVQPKFEGDDAILFFSRFNSKGEPLISPTTRMVTISFDPRIFAWKKPTLTKFEFDVAKIIVNGQVAF